VTVARSHLAGRPAPTEEAEGEPVGVLTILPDQVRTVVRRGETIFQALRRYGYALRAGCREGGCRACVLQLVSGEIEYRRPIADSVLSSEDRSRNLCLPCRAVPRTDVSIQRPSDSPLRRTPYADRLAARDLAGHGQD
jgi:ferredoxin